MKGFWHLPALAAMTCMISVMIQFYWLVIVFILWLLFLYVTRRVYLTPFIVSLSCILFFLYYLSAPDSITINDGPVQKIDKNHFIGKIIGPVTRTDKRIEFIFKDEQLKKKIIVSYFFNTDEQIEDSYFYRSLKSGASCQLNGMIKQPDLSRNPGQFDYQTYLLNKGISYQLTLNSSDDIICTKSSLFHFIPSFRTTLLEMTEQQLSHDTAAWLNALVLGDTSLLSNETTELFQRWSLSHLLAISGLHIGIIAGLIYMLLVYTNLLPKEKAEWLLIFFLPLYALLAGGEPSVLRSSTMVLIFIVLKKVKLTNSYLDILSVVFILLITFDKYIIYHIGFQFSFAVTLGLILSGQWIAQSESKWYQLLQISFVSQMMILPIQLHYFYTFQPLSIILNVIVVPYFSLFVIPLMFMLLIILPLPLVPIQLIDKIFVYIHSFILRLLEKLDILFDFPLYIGQISFSIAIIYYIIFIIFMKYLERGETRSSIKYGSLFIMFILILVIRPHFSPTGSITMLDIGQGEAIVIELPYRRGVYFIDAGAKFSFTDLEPNEKVYRQVIKPYLLSRGIQKVDGIFLSHEDIDHIGSVPYLVAEFNVKELFISPYFNRNHEDYDKYFKQVTITEVGFKEKIIRKGHVFFIISPKKDYRSDNDNSLVIYTKLGRKDWLFTGDAGTAIEKELLTTFPNLSIDVLKVGHHGSDTSTDPLFIKQVKPQVALISVGANNSYGHPREEVIKTLEEAGVIIYRTDQHGAIQYRFNNKQERFQTFLPKKNTD